MRRMLGDHPPPTPRDFFWGALIALALAGCGDTPLQLLYQDVCDDTATSIASRTYTCTEDLELSNSRVEDFDVNFPCADGRETGVDIQSVYACPVALNALSCEQVLAFGNDLNLWVSSSTTCEPLFATGAL